MVQIGKSNLDVLPINLGGNVFGWTADKTASFEVLDAFVDGGGSFIDTADSYSAWVPGNTGGESERIIGQWLVARKPANVVIATKVGMHPERSGQSAANIRAAAEASLKNLGVEAIDLYYVHQDDPETPLEETVAAHAALVQEGLVRYTALSNLTGDRIREWIKIANELNAPLPVALQPKYNLLDREPFESDIQPVAAELGLGVLPWASLASGFLSGKYRNQEDIDAGTSPRAGGANAYAAAGGFDLIDVLDEIAKAHQVSISTVSLAALRERETIAAPIASASRADQVSDLLASARLNLSADELATIQTAAAKVNVGGAK